MALDTTEVILIRIIIFCSIGILALLGVKYDAYYNDYVATQAAIAERNPEAIAAEAGDLLFTIVNLSRFCDFNGEEALRQTIAKFRDRFTFILHPADRSD